MVHPYIALKGELHILSTIFAWVMAWANIIAPKFELNNSNIHWCCLWQRANYLCSTKCSVHSWHRMPSMSDTFLAVFWRPSRTIAVEPAGPLIAHNPNASTGWRSKSARQLWLLRKSLINKLLTLTLTASPVLTFALRMPSPAMKYATFGTAAPWSSY